MPARMLKQQRDRFLSDRRIAVLVTIGPDGEPVPSPIWYLYRDGVFYFRTAASAMKTGNIRRDPRVSICVQDERAPYRALVAHGTASIEAADPRLARELPRRYLGAVGAIGYHSAARAAIEQGEEEITIVVRSTRITTTDFTAETPIYGRAWLLLKRVLPPWL